VGTLGWLLVAVALVAAQRLLELRVSRRNERRARSRGAVEYGRAHYPAMVALHALWLFSTVLEGVARGPEFPALWYVALVAFLLVQPLRYWAILSLEESWNVRVLVVPGGRRLRRGPYRYLSHPNYLVVIVEIAALPMIFGAWITTLVFTALNAAFLYVRICTEERALRDLEG
jgi:methyltransferase